MTQIRIDELSLFRELNKNNIIGVTFSCWDLLHAGHNLFLEDSKNNCNVLCVGLQVDPTIDRSEKNSPIQTLKEREIQIRSCRYVDYYFIYTTEQSLLECLDNLKPDIRFLGDDYVGKRYTGDNLPIKIIFHPRSIHNYSTTNMRKKIYEEESKKLLCKNV